MKTEDVVQLLQDVLRSDTGSVGSIILPCSMNRRQIFEEQLANDQYDGGARESFDIYVGPNSSNIVKESDSSLLVSCTAL